MGANDEEERALLDARFGSGTPATWYVGLLRTPGEDDGTGYTEPPSGLGYSRVAVANTAANFPAATTTGGRSTKANGNPIQYGQPTGNWGNLPHFGMFLNASGGTCRWVQELDTPISPVAASDPPRWAAGDLVLEAD